MAAAFVAAGLGLWIGLTFTVIRLMERRIGGPRLPMPLRDVAIAIVLAVVAVALHPPLVAATLGAACIAQVAAAGADARTGYLFDALTLPTAIVVAFLAIASDRAEGSAIAVSTIVGSFAAIVVLSRGRWMGLGDVKALYALCAAFGPLESLLAIFVACAGGLCVAACSRNLRRGAEIRLGPSLAVGAAFALVAGDPIAARLAGA